MEVTTETQQPAKLRILTKPLDELTDEELEFQLNTIIRPERGRKPTKTKNTTSTATKKPKGALTIDDVDNLTE